jgi:hypothetical protein
MRSGKNALQKLHQETSVEDVLELMEQIQEQAEAEREISAILGNVPALSTADEAEVEAELEALTASLHPKPQVTETLPDVPTTKLPELKAPEKEATTTTPGKVAVPS